MLIYSHNISSPILISIQGHLAEIFNVAYLKSWTHCRFRQYYTEGRYLIVYSIGTVPPIMVIIILLLVIGIVSWISYKEIIICILYHVKYTKFEKILI